MKFEIKHLWALAFAGLLVILGVFMYREPTDCTFAGDDCLYFAGFESQTVYGYRPYGVAVIALAVVFAVAVFAHVRKRSQQ